MYRPHTISDKQFTIENKNLAAVYAVERDIVRLDERIKHSPCAPAVRKTLIRGDALSTLATQGMWLDIYAMMRIEAAASLLEDEKKTGKAIRALLSHEKFSSFDETLRAYWYELAVEQITKPKRDIHIESPEDLRDLFLRCEWGPADKKHSIDFRKAPFDRNIPDPSVIAYEVPNPADLTWLLNDFCLFIGTDTLTPLTQASIAQFQFEALRPFDANLDCLERLIMHYILTRRKLPQNITLPLNLFAGHFKGRFRDILHPYLTSSSNESFNTLLYVEDLTLHMVEVAYEMLRVTLSMNKMITSFIDGWKTRLGRIEKGSAVELLLYHFAGNPILTISQTSKLIGKSFSTTSEAFTRLENAGIIRVGKPLGRNKTFEAREAIALHDGMYQKRAITYEEWSA